MEGKTHAMIGVAVGMAVAYAQHLTMCDAAVLASISSIAALLPDIDHPQAAIRKQVGIASDVAFFWLKHRGFTHTLLALVGFSILNGMYAPLPLALATSAGYASHLLADMMTRSGLALLWPLSAKTIHLPPGMKTGGWLESVVFLLALGEVVALTSHYLQ